jgi:hypothetical protein
MRSRVALVKGMRDIFKILIGKPEGNSPFDKPRHKLGYYED